MPGGSRLVPVLNADTTAVNLAVSSSILFECRRNVRCLSLVANERSVTVPRLSLQSAVGEPALKTTN